jgi:thiamine biosynthesis protein ThiS
LTLTINGEETQVPAPSSIGDLLRSHNIRPEIVVVELNGDISARSDFERIQLNDGDELEIVQMMAGGR